VAAPQSLDVLALPGAAGDVRDLAWRRWEHHLPDGDAALDTMLWLRAARTAWLAADEHEARLWYGRAAHELLDLALGQGEDSGTYAYYAELALGCAAVCGQEPVIERVAECIRLYSAPAPRQRRRGRWSRDADPAEIAQEILRAWAARLTAAPRPMAAAILTAERLAATLPPFVEDRWRESHWPDLLAALEALVDGRSEAMEKAMRSLDRTLSRETRRAPGPTAAVHETLIALASEWRRAFPRSYVTVGETLQLPLVPNGSLGT
jgi:hypothetical protein